MSAVHLEIAEVHGLHAVGERDRVAVVHDGGAGFRAEIESATLDLRKSAFHPYKHWLKKGGKVSGTWCVAGFRTEIASTTLDLRKSAFHPCKHWLKKGGKVSETWCVAGFRAEIGSSTSDLRKKYFPILKASQLQNLPDMNFQPRKTLNNTEKHSFMIPRVLCIPWFCNYLKATVSTGKKELKAA